MTIVGRNRLQQIRDAKMEELLTLSRSVMQTAIENINDKTKWFDASDYILQTEEITLSSIYAGIEVGGQNTIVLASLTQTSEYYLYSNYHTGTLSSRLRTAATQMQGTVNKVMTTHLKAKTTWRRVQKDLNKAGASIGDVPKWLVDLEDTARYYGGDRKAVQQALRRARRAIKGLRPDRELRKAYQRVIDAVEAKNFDAIALKKAAQRAIVEKATYNNERIVRSELARSYNDAFWRRVQDKPEVTLVRHVLSSAHRVPDECTVFAEVDSYALGGGVYPVNKAHNVPVHPSCLCMWEPIIRHIDDHRSSRYSQERTDETLSNYTEGIQKRFADVPKGINPHALPKRLVL